MESLLERRGVILILPLLIGDSLHVPDSLAHLKLLTQAFVPLNHGRNGVDHSLVTYQGWVDSKCAFHSYYEHVDTVLHCSKMCLIVVPSHLHNS